MADSRPLAGDQARIGDAEGPGWEALAHARGIDPEEVRMVYARYQAQLDFAGRRGTAPLPLERWFAFYRLEKASEGEQAGPAPGGCSVDSDAVNDACIRRPADFLQVLAAFAASQTDG